jgi:hypothetical protein
MLLAYDTIPPLLRTSKLIYKFDPSGNLVYKKLDVYFPTQANLTKLIYTSDNHLIVAGGRSIISTMGHYTYIQKMDLNGNMNWWKK